VQAFGGDKLIEGKTGTNDAQLIHRMPQYIIGCD
jgi:hypothetical protein